MAGDDGCGGGGVRGCGMVVGDEGGVRGCG